MPTRGLLGVGSGAFLCGRLAHGGGTALVVAVVPLVVVVVDDSLVDYD